MTDDESDVGPIEEPQPGLSRMVDSRGGITLQPRLVVTAVFTVRP